MIVEGTAAFNVDSRTRMVVLTHSVNAGSPNCRQPATKPSTAPNGLLLPSWRFGLRALLGAEGELYTGLR